MADEASLPKRAMSSVRKKNEPDWEQQLPNQGCTRNERLRSLVESPANLSASQIALFLRTAGFTGVTEGEVLTQAAHERLTLKGRGKHQGPKPRAAALALPAETTLVPVTAGSGSKDAMAKEGERSCKWPIGDPSTKSFHYCGRKAEFGKPYCETHEAKAHQSSTGQHRQPQRIKSARIH